MNISDQISELADNGGRRSRIDRRSFSYSYHIPERRHGGDRRSGLDRRSGTGRVCGPAFNYDNRTKSFLSLG